MSKQFQVKQNISFSVCNNKTFTVAQKFHLDFSFCRVENYPKNKADFTAIINLFSKISSSSNSQDLISVGHHSLSNKGNGKQSEFISNLLQKYNSIYSLDVYHRGGKNGKWRLFYFVDYDNPQLFHILDCFIDNHD